MSELVSDHGDARVVAKEIHTNPSHIDSEFPRAQHTHTQEGPGFVETNACCARPRPCSPPAPPRPERPTTAAVVAAWDTQNRSGSFFSFIKSVRSIKSARPLSARACVSSPFLKTVSRDTRTGVHPTHSRKRDASLSSPQTSSLSLSLECVLKPLSPTLALRRRRRRRRIEEKRRALLSD